MSDMTGGDFSLKSVRDNPGSVEGMELATGDWRLRAGRDGALAAALERIGERIPPNGTETRPACTEREDTPDLRVTAVRRLPAVAAQFVPFPSALDPRLVEALKSRGISELYAHQAEALDHVLAGRNVAVVTPTA